MLVIIGLVLLAAILFGPSAWTRWTMRRHSQDRPDFPGTGGEFARHILDEAGLEHVPVEVTERGDHYDPMSKTVRLSGQNLNGRSLTAVAVAAHEVGHALQDRDQYGPLKWRTRLATIAMWGQRFAQIIMIASPATLVASPKIALLQLGAGLAIMIGQVIVNLVTLPVEFDASFKRALPILEQGRYLARDDLNRARSVLRAAALTYVAGALFSIINVLRWFRFGR